jgi:hypothetical protein
LDGSLIGLKDGASLWSDPHHPLVAVRYKSYSSSDVEHFRSTYCMSNASWVAHDYGKPDMPTDTLGKIWTPTVVEIYVEEKKEKKKKKKKKEEENNKDENAVSSSCMYVVHATFDGQAANEEYGAVSDVFTNYTVLLDSDNGLSSVSVTMGMFNKTTTRLPESMFVQFHPLLDDGSWEASSLGSWLNPYDVLDGGSKRLFGSNKVRASNKEKQTKTMTITSMDSSVVSFGTLNAYPIPTNETADIDDYGMSFVLWDNLWGTNYVQWWPFVVPPPAAYSESSEYFPVDGNANFAARFEMKFEQLH